MDPILDEIDKALTAKGLSAAAASKLAAGHFSLIKNMKASKAGGERYSVESLRKLAQVLDLEFYFGPPRAQQPEPPVLELDGDDFAAIPKLAVEASAGGGAINDDAPEVVGKLAFRQDWLRKIGVKPDRAMLITVTGESMVPTLNPGDLALIDQDGADWRDRQVFALVDLDGGVRIKRIRMHDPRGLMLLSDNTADHPPEARFGRDADRVRCLGRVVWSGHRWE